MRTYQENRARCKRWLKYKYTQLMRAQGGAVNGSNWIFDRHFR